MKEDFLHYLWKFKKFDFLTAKTTEAETLQLLNVGQHNLQSSGPDFFNAKLKIADQVWAGNVEIHLKSSDWYAHKHEQDANYDNVILHVVWEHNVEVFRKDETKIPTLQLKNYVHEYTLQNYLNLVNGPEKWINCETNFASVHDFLLKNWLERLYVERLQEKSKLIFQLLENSENDWEAVLFKLLTKNFGLNKNGTVFLQMASSIPFSTVRKINEELSLEALFFGQANMLNVDIDDAYFLQLQKEYEYVKQKFKLNSIHEKPAFFRLRPHNFPTLRLSQLAQLYLQHKTLFSKLKSSTTLEELYGIFDVTTSVYWENHYSFGKENKSTKKRLSKKFIDLLIINTIIPLKFAYQKSVDKVEIESLLDILTSITSEENSTVKKFNILRKNTASHALDSQALLHLKSNYCDLNKCLHCEIGTSLLQSKMS
ncbi:DUF2851 family protein [Mesonia aestuariivivens]|uniref:DUF2851 family protein n=1 Tax=Mesonia aestuariivivens TaxID=2796128 RepID=A0ABS6VZ35_9FLAO|nr:DUF2851 family protein [Mesonia aestuariivivens]MBW2960845.1 DUF2851 family protein [Mesonia aestuariivivens]